MSKIPNEYRYTQTHEWVHQENKGVIVIGITDYAQSELGEILSVELPEVGDRVNAGDEIGSIESNKTAIDLYSPLSGEVLETNVDLQDAPTLINTDPYTDGWLFKLKPLDPDEFSELLDGDTYSEYLEEDED